jgi:assimilatory nitrate reductase catalytic subunit
MTAIDPDQRAISTTCAYCGVGCGILATPDGRGGAAISGDPEHPANFGRLCSKGSALGETLGLTNRLLYPMIRCGKGTMERVAWSDALDHVAHRFQHIVARDGPGAVAFYLSGQLLTEDYYVANKLMKGFVGSANVDTNSRLCMASSVAGHRRAFGADTVPGCYEDLDEADLLVLVGSNAAWCHPVLYQRMLANKQKRGARMIVIDPRRTDTVGDDDLFLGLKPGTDTALFSGLLVHLADNDVLDRDYIALHTTGFDDAIARARSIAGSAGATALATGLAEQDVAAFFQMFANTERVVTLYSQGVNQSAQGTDKVNAILNCHLATGRIGNARHGQRGQAARRSGGEGQRARRDQGAGRDVARRGLGRHGGARHAARRQGDEVRARQARRSGDAQGRRARVAGRVQRQGRRGVRGHGPRGQVVPHHRQRRCPGLL